MPRPVSDPTARPVTFRLGQETLDRLDATAAAAGDVGRAEALRRAVAAYTPGDTAADPGPVVDPQAVRLDDATRAALDAIAGSAGTDRGETLRLAVLAYGKSPAVAVMQAGYMADDVRHGSAGIVNQTLGSEELDRLRAENESLRAELDRARDVMNPPTLRWAPPVHQLPRPAQAVPGPVIPDTPRVHRLLNPTAAARLARQRDLGPQG